jgi:hypothetical protein
MIVLLYMGSILVVLLSVILALMVYNRRRDAREANDVAADYEHFDQDPRHER